MLIGLGLAVVALAGLEAVPGVFGHDQSALVSEIVVSDVATATAKVDPFAPDVAKRPCAQLESTFGTGNHLFKNRQFGFYASIWPSYQALTSLYVSSLVPKQSECRTDFARSVQSVDANYWDDSVPGISSAYDQGPDPFHFRSDLPRVDDSLWMGLAVLQQYARTGQPALLDRAQAVFHLAVSNWAPSGGIYWEATGANNRSEAVVSNAPAAILGVELFQETGDRSDLVWSQRIVTWLRANLLDSATGLYDDSLDRRGARTRVELAKYTYTEGMMVGAMAMLSMVDPSGYPISDAVALADRSMAYFAAHRSYGQPGFDIIWAENLLWAASVVGNPTFTADARAAVQQCIADEPKPGGDLLTTSSEQALRELPKVPADEYDKLIYVARSGRGSPPRR